MDEFKKTEWINAESAREFIENSDYYILERNKVFKILKSFLKNNLADNKNGHLSVLDLGCGDGRVTQELLAVDNRLRVTLVDGSEEMINKAQIRLKAYSEMDFHQWTFEELIVENKLNKNYDLIVSSLALHHVIDKRNLYNYLYNFLNPGGYFIIFDVVRAPTENLETWYLTLWKEWIQEKENKMDTSISFNQIPDRYKDNPDNYPDKLSYQLNMLKSIGFNDVDCYYKYGIFSIYGGQR
jgi:tRNA (cmo5U34)-methyltransferase